MKHNLKITVILLIMFLITQFIGLAVIKADPFNVVVNTDGEEQKVPNPYLSWIHPPEAEEETDFLTKFLPSIVVAFIIAIVLLFILSKFELSFILRAWFFLVVTFAISLTIYAFEILVPWTINPIVALIIPLIIAIPLAVKKIYGRNFLVHNFTELLIYPGIAAVFVPILSLITIAALLIIISLYDMWAVWHSKFMQNMAKYQIDKLKIFSGFFVPYVSKRVRAKLKKLTKSQLKKKKIKANVAILGGGDIIFPIITAGVMFNTLGIVSALLVIAGAVIGLGGLFFFAEKKKFYPAMPFITAGIFLGIILSYLFF